MIKVPIKILFINKITSVYGEIGDHHPHFEIVDTADEADVIMFENHSPADIRNSAEFKKWPAKCVTVNSEDSPICFLPGCYSSNTKGLLSGRRTRTIPYIRMNREGPNHFIRPFNNEPHQYLYAFRGGATSWLRKKMFKMIKPGPDVFIEESSHYFHWSIDESYRQQKAVLQQEYADLLKNSLFFLCPKGAGSGSIRLFEVMQAGRIPVIISDEWIPVEGFNWDEFSIRIAEKDIARIDEIIRANEPHAVRLANNALQVYNDHFATGPDLSLLANALIAIQNNRNEATEKIIRSLFPVSEFYNRSKQQAYQGLKFLILKGFALTGKKFPYALNRPLEEQIGSAKRNN